MRTLCFSLLVASLSIHTFALAVEPSAEVAELRQRFQSLAEKSKLTHAETDTEIPLLKEPVLNWSNPIRRSPAGALYLFTRDGRPQAAMCMYPSGRAKFSFDKEVQSLTTDSIMLFESGKLAWQPTKPGIRWQEFGPPIAVGATTPARLSQMRRIAKTFSAKLVFNDQPHRPLRLQTTPVYRYPDSGLAGDVIDGAVFTFVQGTDPEVIMMLEAYKPDDADENKWRVAFARMTMVVVTALRDDQTFWEAGGWGFTGLNRPYHVVRTD